MPKNMHIDIVADPDIWLGGHRSRHSVRGVMILCYPARIINSTSLEFSIDSAIV